MNNFVLSHPSFDNICFALKSIINQMDEDDFRPNLIVGLARGGLVPSVMMSQSIHVPMQAVHYSSKKGKGDDRNHNNTIPHLSGYRILCLDDIADSGETLKEVCEVLSVDNEVKTAVIYYKNSAVITPNYYWHELDNDAPFITFPWERNIKYMNF